LLCVLFGTLEVLPGCPEQFNTIWGRFVVAFVELALDTHSDS
jgi:hypothetical protein